MRKLINKKQHGGLLIVKDLSDYDHWLSLSPEEKRLRKLNIARSYLLSDPNITNFYNAAKAMLGGFNPKNPNIQGGIAPTPGLPESNIENVYNIAKIAVNKGQSLFDDFINSPQYLQRIKDTNRVKYLKRFYTQSKDSRPTYVSQSKKDIAKLFGDKEPTLEELVTKHNINHAKILEESRIDHLQSKDYDNILNNIKNANESNRKVNYQNIISYSDGEGGHIVDPNVNGVYNKLTGDVHIKLNANDIPGIYLHEHGGHRIYHKTGKTNFKNILVDDNTANSLIKTRLPFDKKFQDYYTNFDEARARTISVLSKMYNEGFKLSYKGFKDYLKYHNITPIDTQLHPYDSNTIRHLINLIYKNGGKLKTLAPKKKTGGTN